MKTLYKFCLILLFPICVNGQINTFQSSVNRPFSIYLSDSIVSWDSGTKQQLNIKPRLFSVVSANKSDYVSTHLLGSSLSLNLKNKIILSSHFDY